MTWTTAGRPSVPPAEDGPAARGGVRTAVRAGVFVALLASGALVLTACSSGSKSSASQASTPSGSASAQNAAHGDNTQAMDAYRTCLAQHGVKLPTFHRPSGGPRPSGRPSGHPSGRPNAWPSGRPSGFGGGGPGRGFGGFPGFGGASPDAATQKALQACASKRPQFGGGVGGGRGGADASAFQAFTSCLKDHGVTLPTPSPGATNGRGGYGFFRGGRLNTADPKTAKAYAICKPLLPQRPSGGASPSAT